MEVAGAIVSVIGLAGLLSACLDCFQLIERGASFDRDYRILETKFNNQELRLQTWGRACGLVGEGHGHQQQPDGRLAVSDPNLARQVAATLERVRELLSDEKQLRTQYGLKKKSTTGLIVGSEDAADDGNGTSSAGSGYKANKVGFFFKWKREQRERGVRGLLSTARWAVADCERFGKLVQHLKDFNDDLEALTRATEFLPHRQQAYVLYEIEEVDDLELSEIAGVREGEEADVVSDTASIVIGLRSSGVGSVRSSFTIETATGSFYTPFESLVSLRRSRRASGASSLRTFATASEGNSFVTARSDGRIPRPIETHCNGGSVPPIHYTGPPVAPRTGVVWDPPQMTRRVLQCVAIGDDDVPTTALLSAVIQGHQRDGYRSLVFPDALIDIQSDKYQQRRQVALRDTAGQAGYDMILYMSCRNADVLLLCFRFSPNAAKVERSLRRKWIPEIDQNFGGAPVVLVGIHDDSEGDGGGEENKDVARTIALVKPEELIAKETVRYFAHWRVGDKGEALNIVRTATDLAIEAEAAGKRPGRFAGGRLDVITE